MRLMAFKAGPDFNIFAAGDTHEGNAAFSEKAFNKFADMFFSEYEGIGRDKNYLLHMGDPGEFISRTDTRHDPKIHRKTVLQQFKAIRDRYKIFQPQTLGMLDSNHPLTLDPLGNVTEWLCGEEQLNIPYLTYSAKFTFLTKQKEELMFKLYATHGKKTINSAADDEIRVGSNQQLILKRHLKRKASDCAVMLKGHAHKLIVTPPTPKLCLADNLKRLVEFYPDPTKYHQMDYIPWELRWYACTGSFLRTYLLDHNTYSEKAEYDPVDLGFCVVVVRDRKIKTVNAIQL